MSVNKVILVGRVGMDPEVKVLESGSTTTKFSLATGKKYKTKEGEEKETTQWHRVVTWNKLAEVCGEYVKKGKQLYVEGEVQYRSWEDDSGQTKYMTEIVANSVQFLADGKTTNTEEKSSVAPPTNPDGKTMAEKYGVKNYAPSAKAAEPKGIDTNEEIPF